MWFHFNIPCVKRKQAISQCLLLYSVTSPSSNPQNKVNDGRGRAGSVFSFQPLFACHSPDFQRSLAPVCAYVTIMIRIDDRDILISLSSKKGDRGRNLLIWTARLILTSEMVWEKVISLWTESYHKKLLCLYPVRSWGQQGEAIRDREITDLKENFSCGYPLGKLS